MQYKEDPESKIRSTPRIFLGKCKISNKIRWKTDCRKENQKAPPENPKKKRMDLNPTIETNQKQKMERKK